MATFYYNKSDKRYENKTLELVYDDVALTYIDRTDILNPVLKLGKNIDPLKYNYIYIPEFSRYYYVEEPPTFDAGFYTVKLHVDVLMSWKDDINKQNVIVSRQRDYFDRYLEDDKIKAENYECVRTLQFPYGFNSLNIILGVVGKTSSNNS